jgi:hypothetical protein
LEVGKRENTQHIQGLALAKRDERGSGPGQNADGGNGRKEIPKASSASAWTCSIPNLVTVLLQLSAFSQSDTFFFSGPNFIVYLPIFSLPGELVRWYGYITSDSARAHTANCKTIEQRSDYNWHCFGIAAVKIKFIPLCSISESYDLSYFLSHNSQWCASAIAELECLEVVGRRGRIQRKKLELSYSIGHFGNQTIPCN